MILAGDIGGTKTYLGRFTVEAGKVKAHEIACFRTLSFEGLEPMVLEFLGGRRDVGVAAFGIPGPVVNERVDVTNVPWSLDATRLGRDLNIRSVHLVNDLVATGYGTQALSGDDLFCLNEGKADEGLTEALLAAGTGLGECVLHWDGARRSVLPCEAGHAAFAPHDSLQAELLQFLMRRSRYVCVERVLSGPGLLSIYEFLRETKRASESSAVAEAMREGDAAAVIATHAENGTDELCCSAMEVFVSAYGSEAGNLAVRTMALGGIYVGGGIAPKIVKILLRGAFMRSFVQKERMEELLENIPVRIILDDRTGLRGAALMAYEASSKANLQAGTIL
jgi:glucokinase